MVWESGVSADEHARWSLCSYVCSRIPFRCAAGLLPNSCSSVRQPQLRSSHSHCKFSVSVNITETTPGRTSTQCPELATSHTIIRSRPGTQVRLDHPQTHADFSAQAGREGTTYFCKRDVDHQELTDNLAACHDAPASPSPPHTTWCRPASPVSSPVFHPSTTSANNRPADFVASPAVQTPLGVAARSGHATRSQDLHHHHATHVSQR